MDIKKLPERVLIGLTVTWLSALGWTGKMTYEYFLNQRRTEEDLSLLLQYSEALNLALLATMLSGLLLSLLWATYFYKKGTEVHIGVARM